MSCRPGGSRLGVWPLPLPIAHARTATGLRSPLASSSSRSRGTLAPPHRWGTLAPIFPAVRVRPHRRGFFLGSWGRVRDHLGGATRRRLPGPPECLSPRPRCVLRSRRFREPGPGRSTCSRPSAGEPRVRRPPRRCSYLPRSSQSASRLSVVRRVSAADGQASQQGWWTRDGDIARSALPTRMAEASRSREGHRRGSRRRLRHDGRSP